ncbi:MAG: diacylglycerol/lipid kinase family protein [Solirubrobacteraceae bacterium]
MSARRAAAIGALLLGFGGFALAVVVAVQEFPRGLIALACVALAAVAAWFGVLRRGAVRVAGLSVGVLGLGAAILLLLSDRLLEEVLVVGALALSGVCARAAFGLRVHLPQVAPPRRPVLFFNPKSGGGKAERFSLAAEARARGIEPIELGPPWDLEGLVRDAVARGADGLAMAGGDGSQAVVAAIAAELDLPYACVPAGTRNHFALDLGVDRDDVVGALDAFVDGGERRVDLADVNERVFVNNVSLGLYADAVQRKGYRDAKLRTLLDTVPEVLGPEGTGLDLRWTGPDAHKHHSGAAILVSNNRYRLGHAVGSGTRPRIDDGLLGITVVSAPTGGGDGQRPQRPWREWTALAFEVDSDDPVPAGIDGEAATLEPPLLFHIRPGVLRVRIAPRHPGASPSAMMPDSLGPAARALARISAGRDPLTAAAPGPSLTSPPHPDPTTKES